MSSKKKPKTGIRVFQGHRQEPGSRRIVVRRSAQEGASNGKFNQYHIAHAWLAY